MVKIFSLAFIGKLNEPLYLLTLTDDEATSLELQYIMHSALDIVEEKKLRR